MGWLYTYGASRADIIRELTETKVGTNAAGAPWSFETLRHCTRGNVLWCLHKYSDGHKGIACYLLQRSRDGWGYKGMEEDMGPYYWTCPLSYLDQADPPQSEFARQWREAVRARAA